MVQAPTECKHWWRIETPQGETSNARCKHCGATREFANSGPSYKTFVRETGHCSVCGYGNNSREHREACPARFEPARLRRSPRQETASQDLADE